MPRASSPASRPFASHLLRRTGLNGLMLMAVMGMAATGVAQAQTTSSTSSSAAPTTQTTTPKPQTPPATTTPATTTATPEATPPAEQSTVTVVGEKPQNRIDRQTYDNTKNIDSATGTAADALNKVPSVNVDSQGNVTLRGQSNVQVMIDGKPSAMMSGDNRAAALQAMSSGDIQSVEVINNPGAQFGSEGTGGVINLVMRRNRKPGKSGAVIANIGSEGRYNGSLSGSYSSSKVTLTGGVNLRHDVRPSSSHTVLQQKDVTTGAITSSTTSDGNAETDINNYSVNGGIDYNLNDNDSISFQVNAAHREFNTQSTDTYVSTGTINNAYTRRINSKGPRDDGGFDLTYNHKGQLPGETLKVGLRVSVSDGTFETDGVSTYTSPTTNTVVDTKSIGSNTQTAVFSVDYNRPVGEAIVTTGIQIQRDENSFKNESTIGGVINTGLTNRFDYEQTLNAAYITYQIPIGEKWTVLGGLRAEQLILDTHQISPTPTDGHIDYTKVNPSFFATRVLTDNAKLRFSYSHRLQRPSAQDLNPYVTYVDEKNVNIGNPNLKPQETDSFELGYEYTSTAINYQIRGYYRKNEKAITSYSYYRTDGVLVTTKQNYGSGESSGLEGNIQGKLGKSLGVSINGNLFRTELTTPNIAGTQSATSASGRVALDYAVTPKDRMQFMIFSSGKQLTGQGYRSPFTMANISYRHQYSQKLAFIASVNDPFQMGRMETVTDTNTVHNVSTRKIGGQVFYLGLSYTLGGAAPANQQQRMQGPRMMGPGGPGGPGM